MFFAVEGIDRTGKTTLVKNLHKIAAKSNKSCIRRSFPAYTETVYGKIIRMYLNGYFGPLEKVDLDFINMIYASDRYELKDKLINEIQNYQLVICDRYTASNLSYSSAKILHTQYSNEKIDLLEIKHINTIDIIIRKIIEIEQNIMSLPCPEIYLLLDADYEKLPSFNNSNKDLHEQDTKYINTVSAVYRHLANNNILGQWNTIKLIENNRCIPQLELADKVWNEIILTKL